VNAFLVTPAFRAWLRSLRDPTAKARILARIRSAEAGNFGDCTSVGGGVREMRVHVGAGYRVYFCRRENTTYLLLCGGDKGSQQADIRAAQALRAQLDLL
jgi:putative addiction module killer protein